MEMDTEQNGHVTKQGFMQFLRYRPEFRRLLVHAGQDTHKDKLNAGAGKGYKESIGPKEAEAIEMRRVLKLLREIDEDGNGCMEFEEFIAFWRKSGFLLEYESKSNPRDQIADVLGQIHEDKIDGRNTDDKLSGHLSSLAKKHLSTESRRKSEDLTASLASAGGASSIPYVVRRNSDSFKNTGQMMLQSPGSTANGEGQRFGRRKSV
jgi:hypothetical protein